MENEMSAIVKKLERAHDKARRKHKADNIGQRGLHKKAQLGKVDKDTAEAIAWLLGGKW